MTLTSTKVDVDASTNVDVDVVRDWTGELDALRCVACDGRLGPTDTTPATAPGLVCDSVAGGKP